ncbi:MAG TPA: D-alanine--D-alanine ligase [Caldithrix abyssi]|uniref:D-alanine--D-alanine ligase n=1 Tax=Caldithrix abyssi TaxID=187145 RepID=A0A7V1LNM9_CALAY|nr:D-alanine--D-alanine ligase [Caldithrix abyssi]
MHVIVLLGGDSPEREVSLSSGKNIVAALRENGHRVTALDPGNDPAKTLENIYQGIREVQPRAEVVFNALHGGTGENGIIQSVLQMMHIPFTGSGAEASMLAMDKVVSKLLAQGDAIATPAFLEVKQHGYDHIREKLGLPFIIKPVDGGSSLGFHIIERQEDFEPGLRDARTYGEKILAEQYIAGAEIAAGVLKGEALPLVHIIPSHRIYDYTCKYTEGMSQYIVPAVLSDTLTKEIQDIALKIYRVLRLKNYARIDFLVGEKDIPYFIEANTLPGMTSTSLLPKAAGAAGITFKALLEIIIQDAVDSYGN